VLNRWIRSTALGYDRMITAAHLRFGPDFYALYGWEKPPKRTRLRAFVSFRETWSAPSILESLEDEEPHFGTWGASGIVLWLPSPSPPLDLLFTIPRNLRSSTIDNLTINALVDESLARHHPHPLHFTDSFARIPQASPSPSSVFVQLVQLLLPPTGTPVLRNELVYANATLTFGKYAIT
jgi:hypothetical protein